MERRHFISTATAFAAASTVAGQAIRSAFAADKKDEHAGHHGGGGKNQALIDATVDCVKKGEACIQHCVDMFAAGDTSMGACAKTVREMLTYCQALNQAATQDSKHLKAIAKIAHDACKDCEAECRKHEKHEVCGACADACVECAKACKAAMA